MLLPTPSITLAATLPIADAFASLPTAQPQLSERTIPLKFPYVSPKPCVFPKAGPFWLVTETVSVTLTSTDTRVTVPYSCSVSPSRVEIAKYYYVTVTRTATATTTLYGPHPATTVGEHSVEYIGDYWGK
ncbi:hypothetical protein L13192_07709 [Pyrenophora tritici-repentis]|uniref:Uncharacterized protein n=2 Tax=Pyrenophora tritici-repentis TaxID=45151 RepID=A0A922N6B5_9PLEO|nr:uncharacterized protein PTRG_05037 [Pyrenophora tritici-repentis Pt-1C-BFP]EDU47944.1 predicted protein [Pyrenophora tritici-repentis Pt-1C-BFP]KAI1510261.1 hypothetical protein Ptr86124_010707 [Pyrenophora tritici-repentis]KAI1668573.1 hypothetical protein L13192_07709 [Pyrenophora tritici-repentis]KAI1680614.1 hypothetical protein KJE20_09465 [Pyrenophora tritici-repentis]